MRALVTGPGGIVGANLVRALLERGWSVRALVRKPGRARALAGLPVELAAGDVLEPPGLRVAAEGVDVVFHTAARFAYWGVSPAEMERVAVTGTRNVIAAARAERVARVVLTASSVIFGSAAQPALRNETSAFTDVDASPYAITKMRQERVAVHAAREAGVELVSVCPTLVVGPFDFGLGTSNAIIVNYLNDPYRTTFSGGCNIVSARDVALGHLLAAERGAAFEAYILGSENLAWSDVHRIISDVCGTSGPTARATHTTAYLTASYCEALARATGTRPVLTRTEVRMMGRYYWYDDAKARELGYSPAPTRDAIIDAARWLARTEHIHAAVRATLRIDAAREPSPV